MPAKSSSTTAARHLAIASISSIAMLALAAGAAFADGSSPSGNVIKSVDYAAEQASTKVIVRGSSTPTFTIYKLDRPSRVVVDIANASLDASLTDAGETKTTIEANTWAVGQIAAHRLEGTKQQVVRVVVGMARSGTYKVRAAGSNVVITVTAREVPPVSAGAGDTAELDAARRAAETARKRAAKAEAEAEAARQEASAQAARAAAVVRDAEAKTATTTASAVRIAETARKEAEAARLQAERERNLARASEEAARQRAEAAIAQARIEAAAAKQKSQDDAREVAAHAAKAEAMIKDANDRLAKAKSIERAAATAMANAAKAQTEVKAREEAAAEAERRADRARADASRAAKAAAQYQADAKAAATGNSDSAGKLAKRAEDAAAAAESRRRAAEEATVLAEARRAEAESAAKAASVRSSEAIASAKDAEAKRSAAEADRRAAEAARASAETAAADAERQRKAFELAARQAEAGAERATKLRTKEEAALAKTAEARKLTEARRIEAERALAALNDSVVAARASEAQASSRRDAAQKADAAANKAERDRASQSQIAATRAEADRLQKELQQAEAQLAKHQSEVRQREQALSKLDSARGKAQAELEGLRAAADKARLAREKEEKAVADLVAKRTREEAALAASRKNVAQQRRVSTAPRTERARVKSVEFVDSKEFASVAVDVAGSEPKLVSAGGRRAVLEIADADLPANLERTLDTSRFAGPIRSVSTYRAPGDANTVRIVVDLAEEADSDLVRGDKGYQLRFAKRDNSTNRKPTARPPARTAEMPSPVVGGYGASSTPITQKTVAQLSRGKKVYRGTQIDLDFKDADIHNLLRLLADVGGVNIVVPDEIRAKVTVRMRRVPWDQALEVILASKGLWYRRDGNLYRVAPRKQLDAEDQAEAERIQSLVQAEAPEPEIFTLNYVVAKDLSNQLQPLLSPKGRIEVDTRTNSLIVSDIKAHRRRIIDLAARLDTQTPQIQIEARIVEARSTFIREFGIQWGGSALASAAGGNATGLLFPNSVGLRGGADDNQANTNGVSASPTDFAINMPAAVGAGSGGALGLSLGSVGGNFNLNLRLSALEDSGSVRIISAPKITVLNNISAEISQGVSIPISVVSANGVQTQFVPADLSLKVVPHVSQRDCSIAMEIQVTKNEADFVNTGSRGDPTILRKEAKTTILVNDGETSVMGGIYTRNTGLSNSKVPFFGDIPVLGWLFKNRRENDERTEVLVFITPKITNKGFLRCE